MNMENPVETERDENSLVYKIEKVYTSLFDLKKFKKLVYEGNRKEVIALMKFYTEDGSLGVGIGWSEKNHTIVDICGRGVYFNNDMSQIYSFKTIAELLINQYGKYQQLSLFPLPINT